MSLTDYKEHEAQAWFSVVKNKKICWVMPSVKAMSEPIIPTSYLNSSEFLDEKGHMHRIFRGFEPLSDGARWEYYTSKDAPIEQLDCSCDMVTLMGYGCQCGGK